MKFFEATKFNLLILTVVNLLAAESVLCDRLELKIHNQYKPEECEREARATDLVTLHYKGTLLNGQEFDSSFHRREPFQFQLGIGQVIKGWDQGLKGVCAGEQIRLVIPPHLAYGDSAHSNIPASSTLVFDIDVLKVEAGPHPINVFRDIDHDDDSRLSRDEVREFLRKQLALAPPGAQDVADHHKITEEVFEAEDKDNDGYITHEEFSGPKYDRDEL